mmetsp:Transcript_91218/g.181356  ORF Transcript_91218/g.181356 Transcript_91218/m.181356 type:complete len:99 (+) Transcript_91218:339-635(+)
MWALHDIATLLKFYEGFARLPAEQTVLALLPIPQLVRLEDCIKRMDRSSARCTEEAQEVFCAERIKQFWRFDQGLCHHRNEHRISAVKDVCETAFWNC